MGGWQITLERVRQIVRREAGFPFLHVVGGSMAVTAVADISHSTRFSPPAGCLLLVMNWSNRFGPSQYDTWIAASSYKLTSWHTDGSTSFWIENPFSGDHNHQW